jgi:RimJ/RimL family protein N-acetyltransferase
VERPGGPGEEAGPGHHAQEGLTLTPALVTGRLSLEPLRVDHADEMVDLLADRALYRFYDDEASPSLDELRERYARQSAGSSADGSETWHNWILRLLATGSVAGFVQATVVGDVVDLAWVVGTSYQGQGLASEAALAVRDSLAPAGSGVVLQAHIAPGHAASEAVAGRIGLALTSDVDADGERLWRSPAG